MTLYMYIYINIFRYTRVKLQSTEVQRQGDRMCRQARGSTSSRCIRMAHARAIRILGSQTASGFGIQCFQQACASLGSKSTFVFTYDLRSRFRAPSP